MKIASIRDLRNTYKDLLRWVEAGRPAGAVTHGKFYSVHLQDASADDRGLIEQHLGLAFQFDDNGGVRWVRIESIEPSQT